MGVSQSVYLVVFWSHTHHKIGKLLTNIIQTSVFFTVVY